MRTPRRLGVLLALCTAACTTVTHHDPPATGGALVSESGHAGESVEGRPIEFSVLGDGEEVVLVLATIHGDEPVGTELVRLLEGYLRGHPEHLEGITCILVPVVNPDGLEAGTRRNANGVDLNRNFMSANFEPSSSHGSEPLSEPEARAIVALVERFRPDRVASLHQPLSCIDWDGPADRWAEAVAARADLPLRRLGARPGSLGSWAGLDRELPVVTVEFPSGAQRRPANELWHDYGALMLSLVTGR